jgi:hypothetical protein
MGFEPAIPASHRPQTYALDLTAIRIGVYIVCGVKYVSRNDINV